MKRIPNFKVYVKWSDDFFRLYHKNDLDINVRKSIDDRLELLKENPFVGINIQFSKIPSYYIKKYKTKSLSRIELANYWRLLYYVTRSDIYVRIIILEALNHKQYNNRFGYRK